MISNEALFTIKASVPALKEHGIAITTHFYRLLFERNPQLKNLFNMSNQERSDTAQARALADAIFAFANYVETPEKLSAMVNRIAHKHTSLSIQPEHYPLVGDALLSSMSQVLKLPFDHPIITGWSEAYDVLANIFITQERALYQNSKNLNGGWLGYRPFKVVKIVSETSLVKSFYLSPKDQKPLPAFLPGQYVSVKVPGSQLESLGFEHQAIRQYSLSDQPNLPHWRISVKAETGHPNGVVSNYLHGCIAMGDTIELSPPSGDFVLADSLPDNRNSAGQPAVFISAGIGITPLLSMLKSRLQNSAKGHTTFIHCALNSDHHTLKTETAELAKNYPFNHYTVYSNGDSGDHQGLLDNRVLEACLAPIKNDLQHSNYYFCGPSAFMSSVKRMLLEKGVSGAALHHEVFGPTVAI